MFNEGYWLSQTCFLKAIDYHRHVSWRLLIITDMFHEGYWLSQTCFMKAIDYHRHVSWRLLIITDMFHEGYWLSQTCFMKAIDMDKHLFCLDFLYKEYTPCVIYLLTQKHLKTHECVLSTAAFDALVLKHCTQWWSSTLLCISIYRRMALERFMKCQQIGLHPEEIITGASYMLHMIDDTLRVSCQKGPTRHAYAWQIGPFWQDALDICLHDSSVPLQFHFPTNISPTDCITCEW